MSANRKPKALLQTELDAARATITRLESENRRLRLAAVDDDDADDEDDIPPWTGGDFWSAISSMERSVKALAAVNPWELSFGQLYELLCGVVRYARRLIQLATEQPDGDDVGDAICAEAETITDQRSAGIAVSTDVEINLAKRIALHVRAKDGDRRRARLYL